jgi:protein TonB
MKASVLFIFLGISVLVHLVVGGALYFYGEHHERTSSTEVLDLTVMPYEGGAPKSSSPSTKHSLKSVPASAESVSPDSAKNIPIENNQQTGTGNSASGGSADGSEGGGLGEWTQLTQKPKVTKEVKARYTDEARAKGLEGLVVCDLVIGENGRIRSVTLVQGLGSGLDEAALEALKAFEFSPAKIGDRAVAVKIRYKYRFQLQHQ